MKQLRKIPVLIFVLFGFSACSVIDDTLLTEEVSDFSRNVVELSAVINNEFELAEELNTLGFIDNLQFQLELGGYPETAYKPLFQAEDIAARRSVLSALDGYVEMLAVVTSGQSISSVYTSLSGAVGNLKSLSSDNFSIDHSLSFLDSNQLVADLSLFDELLILPDRDKRLLPIVEKGDKTLKKAAVLLLFDIGAPEDQSSKCSYTVPKNDVDADMTSLRLCKGGLRAIVKNAIDFDTNTWNDKLAQTSKSSSVSTLARRDAIKRVVSIQKFGLEFDKLLNETQMTLIAMVAAHKSISETLEAAEGMQAVSLSVTLKGIVFKEKVRELVKSLSMVRAELSDLADSVPAMKSVQTTTLNSLQIGNENDNQQ
ncbi:hypothetical protein [uncultured Sneathiella sp.]|uniref:hypothetical protein n=1 Tax=uncultured Sneathiella sp. TaxID=879315 RepID=UPI0030ECC387|tara:strand:+ start:15337 stop:16446 length:1110 start_codon:yes stop_codon:yes gene_type:complete